MVTIGRVNPGGHGVRREREVGEAHLTDVLRALAGRDQAPGGLRVVEAGDRDGDTEQRRGGGQLGLLFEDGEEGDVLLLVAVGVDEDALDDEVEVAAPSACWRWPAARCLPEEPVPPRRCPGERPPRPCAVSAGSTQSIFQPGNAASTSAFDTPCTTDRMPVGPRRASAALRGVGERSDLPGPRRGGVCRAGQLIRRQAGGKDHQRRPAAVGVSGRRASARPSRACATRA